MRFSDPSKSATVTGFLAATTSLTTRHGSNGKTGPYSTKARRRHLQGSPSLGGRSEAQERAYVVPGCDSSESLTGSKEGPDLPVALSWPRWACVLVR
jgi:hypothetical protein